MTGMKNLSLTARAITVAADYREGREEEEEEEDESAF